MLKTDPDTAELLKNPHDRDLARSKLSRTLQFIGIALFVLGLVVSAVFLLTDHWRRSTFTLGVALLFLTILRLVCDSSVLGPLAVRSRRFDAIFTGVLGGLMVFLAASVDALGS